MCIRDSTLSVSMLVSLCACRNANPESLSAHIVDIGTKTVTTVKTGARLCVAFLLVHSLVTSVYTVLLHFKCKTRVQERSRALSWGASCHRWSILSANIWNMKTHKKRLWLSFCNLGIRKKKTRKKSFKPVLNWLTLSYAPGVTFLLIHLKLKPTFFFKL